MILRRGMAGVFSDKVKTAENRDGEIKDLHAETGQLAVENDFFYKGLGGACIQTPPRAFSCQNESAGIPIPGEF